MNEHVLQARWVPVQKYALTHFLNLKHPLDQRKSQKSQNSLSTITQVLTRKLAVF